MRLLLTVLLICVIPNGWITAQEKSKSSQPNSQALLDGFIMQNVTVTDKNNRIPEKLDRAAFTVYDNGVPQEITLVESSDLPLSVGIIYDMSGSMRASHENDRRMLEIIKAGLARFIHSSNRHNEYFLIGFNQKVELLSDWTHDGNVILSRVSNIRLKGYTAFYDALYWGIEKLREARHKRVVLLFSDGQDNSSRRRESELRRLLKETEVQVYVATILVEPKRDAWEVVNLRTLDEFASWTGGRSYMPKTAADLNRFCDQIALELRHQYLIGYRPHAFTRDGKWHNIKIKAKAPTSGVGEAPSLMVRSRKGYFARTHILERIQD